MFASKKVVILLITGLLVLFISLSLVSGAIVSTKRISTDSAGNQANGVSVFPFITPDTRYIVFVSNAYNLTAKSNGIYNVYLKNTATGAVTLISSDSNGNPGTHYSWNGAVSNNGRFVAFYSWATNFGFNNTKYNVYLKNVQTGTLTMISTDAYGNEGNNHSYEDGFPPAISSDSRYVAFTSKATNLVPGDTNGKTDIFLKDIKTGALKIVSTNASGRQANGSSGQPIMSANGRYLVFFSLASNLVKRDPNRKADIFIKNIQTGGITRVSTSSSNKQSNGFSSRPAISSNGRYITFASSASNLVSKDTNSSTDIFLKDRKTNKTILVSTNSKGQQTTGKATTLNVVSSVSDNGRYVGFTSAAKNLVPADTNGYWDVFVKDTRKGHVWRVSTNVYGNQASGDHNSWSGSPVLSSSGHYIAFISSYALVPDDTNKGSDVFLAKMDTYKPKTYAPKKTTVNLNKKPKIFGSRALATAKVYWKVKDPRANNNKAKAYVELRIKKRLGISKTKRNKKARYNRLYKLYRKKYLTARKKRTSKKLIKRNKSIAKIYYKRYRISLKKKHSKKAAHYLRLYRMVKKRYLTYRNRYNVRKILSRRASKYKRAYRKTDPYNYKIVKKVNYKWTKINRTRYYKWRTRSKGVYKFYVYATDAAGNRQRNVASNYVIVK